MAKRSSQFMRRRGSVLIIVMVTLLFTTIALVAFMDKASNDLLVEQRDALAHRLRREAYSALEVTLAVLEDFRQVGNGLRSPAEGWYDPLGFAGYEPTEGRTVEVTFEDESGKLSLPRMNNVSLAALFKNWGVADGDADELTDALLGWMKKDHLYKIVSPRYEFSDIPYEPPLRALRSFTELAAIEKARDFFYDADGHPNEYYYRFVDSVSLLDFQRPNINGAKPDTLAAAGQFDESQQQAVVDHLRGVGNSDQPQFFQTVEEAASIAGPTGNAGAFGVTISALRVNITVREGKMQFRLSVVVTPQGASASINNTTATTTRAQVAAANNPPSQQQNQQNQAPSSGLNRPNPNSTAQNLRYPFTLLEIRENDEIPSALPPPVPKS